MDPTNNLLLGRALQEKIVEQCLRDEQRGTSATRRAALWRRVIGRISQGTRRPPADVPCVGCIDSLLTSP